MKAVVFFATLIMFCIVNCEIQSQSESATSRFVASSVNVILQDYFAAGKAKVDIFFYGVKGGVSQVIAQLILQHKPQCILSRVSHLQESDLRKNRNPIKLNSIHIFDSKENFLQILQLLYWHSADPAKRYEQLIYIPELTKNDMANGFRGADGDTLMNIHFLVLQPASIELVALFMFTTQSCRTLQPTVINRFHRNTKQWETSNFFPARFQNLNGCTLMFGGANPDDFFMLKFVLETIAKHLNFSIYIINPASQGKNEIDAAFLYDENNMKMSENAVASVVVETDIVAFFIPPSDHYSQLEKLFMAFEIEVWIAILAAFVILLVMIQVVNFMSNKVQNFVFGLGVHSPSLNLFSIFLHGGQHRVPNRNFARFILILFVVWSLVIRTCYQSKLYEFLQADLRKPRCETIDELIENNFTLLYRPVNIDLFLSKNMMAQFKNKIILDTNENLSNAMTSKSTFISFRNRLTRTKKKTSAENRLPLVYPLAENLRSSHISVLFIKFSQFYESFNELIERMVTHGLTDCKLDSFFEKDRKPEEVGPQVLTLHHIGIGFFAVAIFLSLSVVVFIGEHLYHYLFHAT